MARGAGLLAGLWLAGAAAAQQIDTARYDGPTTRYPHGVLGDDVEWAQLVVRLTDGRVLSARLGEERVFEDLAPRLADLDGDGAPEVVVVESHAARGARLAIWGLVGDDLRPITATPWIGTRFRWLAPLGAADLDGDGRAELAYVDRPHLARTLRVWRYLPEGPGAARLDEVAAAPGYSNHRIGWDYIEGGIRACGTGPEMVLAGGDWRDLYALRLAENGLTARRLGRYSPDAIARAMACR
ncbi:FG-GAP repeat domain-containing protein [Pseudoponticoccus marisrubri]|uniref:VCBS repeat-containing protein n=1 Tax=Pseudoponticoccus marisrubri TaxID=1685382 RepID=A0A0W7WQH6_9RHOB|nr:VCBS repeat-containing protein [Pseudoponticoccus marisrubri]KUF12828.1 hypothetical protein AVJ23_00460 [Pseudoponticoccus marisrubri]